MTLLDAILAILKEEDRNGLHVDMIVERLKMYPDVIEEMDDIVIKRKTNAILLRESKKKGSSIKKAKDPKKKTERKGVYRFVQHRDTDVLPKPEPAEPSLQPTQVQEQSKKDTNFTGKGGEYAVLGELLFNGYNANVMAVDEGIDIYATKNNLIFFVQVKTTFLNRNKVAYFTIKRSAFIKTDSSQVRYILVIRCGNGEMRYFSFKSADIDRFIFDKLINGDDNKDSLNINIRYEDDNRPYLYRDNKSEDISFYQNNFNL